MELDLSFLAHLGDDLVQGQKAQLGVLGAIEDATTQYQKAQFLTLTNEIQLSAAGYGIIDLDGPPAGFRWIIRSVAFSDATSWSASMGTATVQFGKGQIPVGQDIANQPIAPSTVRWPFTVCPNAATFGTNHFQLRHGERIYCQIIGGNTTGQVIQATIEYERWAIIAFPRAI